VPSRAEEEDDVALRSAELRAHLAAGAAHRVAHEFDPAANAAMPKELLVEVAT
jgi:hypothetical protein